MAKMNRRQTIISKILSSWQEDCFSRLINDPKNAKLYGVDFYSLTGTEIASLLCRCAHPNVISLCDLGRLSDKDWKIVIKAQPKMKKYRKRCQLIAPSGNAAFGITDILDKGKNLIPDELSAEAKGIADMLNNCFDGSKANTICSAGGFDKSRFQGFITEQGNHPKAGPLLFVFSDSPYDADTLVNLIRRAMQITIEEDWTDGVGDNFCFPFAVIKNFETYSILKSRKTAEGAELVGSYFSNWTALEYNYPELDGITLFCDDFENRWGLDFWDSIYFETNGISPFYGETERIVQRVLAKRQVIEKWMEAESRLPLWISAFNLGSLVPMTLLQNIIQEELQERFPELISYCKSFMANYIKKLPHDRT